MKEKDFDNILKQKLEGINEAPPAYMWDKISSGIPATAPSSSFVWFTNNMKAILVAASIIIASGISYLVFNTETKTIREANYKSFDNSIDYVIVETFDNADNIASTELLNASDISISSSSTSSNTKSDISKSNTSNKRHYVNSTKNIQPTSESSEINDAAQVESIIEKPSASEIRKTNLNQVVNISDNGEPKLKEAALILAVSETSPSQEPVAKPSTEQKSETTKEVKVETETPNEPTQTSEEEINTSQEETVTDKEDKTQIETAPEESETKTKNQDPRNRQLNKYAIGLHYGPEFINAGEFKLTDQAIDFSFNYQNMNFILETGLGLRFSEDKTAYNMTYERWEYAETQIRFDSVTFVLDVNGNYVPQPVNPYYEEVYDSINHSYYATATVQNTMIQIPLLLGYQKDYKHFAIFVKGGIRYSLIIYQQTKGLLEIDGQSRLLTFNYPEKTRAKSNIDYELSVGGAYKLNKHFQLQAEVFGRYYHYPIFEENPPRETNPWSSSFRLGILYVF